MDIFDIMSMTNPSSPIYQANELSKQYMNNERINEEQEDRDYRYRNYYDDEEDD